MMNRLALSLCALTALTLTACGDDDTPGMPEASLPEASMMDAAMDALMEASIPDATPRPDAGPGGQEGLLISEVSTMGPDNEYVEIWNPTDGPIDLTNVYLTDNSAYTRFAAGMPWAPSGTAETDYLVRFPAGATIDAGQVILVAFGRSTPTEGMEGRRDLKLEDASFFIRCPDYLATGFTSPDDDMVYCDDAVIPLMIVPTNGGAGRMAGSLISNRREMVMLFRWTGGLAQDVDYIIWGTDDDSATRVDKTEVAGYQADTSIALQNMRSPAGPGNNESLSRCAREMDEVTTGGNGITGHDETSENFSASWMVGAPSPGTVNACLGS